MNELVKQVIKEMFENGEIEIIADIRNGYDGKYIETAVMIDRNEVYSNKEYI